MFRLIPSVSSPLISVFILMLGVGLMYSLTPLHLQAMGHTEWVIGVVTAVHAIGMMLGSINDPRRKQRGIQKSLNCRSSCSF